MNIVLILYVFILFYVFTPGTIITLPFKSSKMVHSMIHALLFSIMLFLTYDMVSVTEGMSEYKHDGDHHHDDHHHHHGHHHGHHHHGHHHGHHHHSTTTIAPATTAPATIAPATIAPATIAPATTRPATTRPAVKQTFKIYENNTNNYLLAEPHSSGMAISKTAQSDLATKFYFDSQSFPGFILISTSDDTMFLRLFGKLSSDSKTPEQTSFINSSNASNAKQQLGNITTTNIVDHANIFSYLGVQYNMTATTAPATTAPATTRPATIKPIDIAPVFSSHRIGGCAGTEEGCSASPPFGPNFANFF